MRWFVGFGVLGLAAYGAKLLFEEVAPKVDDPTSSVPAGVWRSPHG
jgi:hypothetical protein